MVDCFVTAMQQFGELRQEQQRRATGTDRGGQTGC